MIITCPKCGRVIQLDSAGKELSNFTNHNCLYATALTLFESRKGIIQPAEVIEAIWGNPCVPDSSKVKIRLNDHTICWVNETQTYPTLHNEKYEDNIKKKIITAAGKSQNPSPSEAGQGDENVWAEQYLNNLQIGTPVYITRNGPRYILEEIFFDKAKVRKPDGTIVTVDDNMKWEVKVKDMERAENTYSQETINKSIAA